MSKFTISFIATLFILALLAGCAPATPTASAPPTAVSSGYPADSGNPPVQSNPAQSSGYPAAIESTPAAPSAETGYPAQVPAASGNGLQVVASNGTTKAVTMADLNDLPKATVGSESGPKLIDVLQFAGVFDFSTVTITGSNGSKDLPADQVNDQVILGLANNTVTLVVNGAASDQAIKDITSIKVK